MILQLDNPPTETKVATLCSESPRPVGAEVIAIGHPSGFRFATTPGAISAVYRTDELPDLYRSVVEAPDEHVWLQKKEKGSEKKVRTHFPGTGAPSASHK